MATLRFQSHNEAVSKLVFRELPAHRTTVIVRAIRDGRQAYMLGSRGTIYATSLRGGNVIASLRRATIYSLSPLRAAVELGALRQRDYEDHAEKVRNEESSRKRQHDARELEYMASDYGFLITQAQKRKMGIK